MRIRQTLPRVVLMGIAALAFSGESARGQSQYPSQNVNLLVASAAGGITDIVARLVWQKVGEKFGQTVVVEIRAGSGGNLAARAVSAAAADGYTVLATTTAIAINDTAYKNKGYATEDLRPVGIVAFSPDVVAVNPSNPAKTFAEYIANGRQKSFTYATAGVGTAAHIGAEYLFKEISKIEAVHVPYTGGAPALTAVLGNHVDSLVLAMPVVTPYLVDGRLRGLALSSATRSTAAPMVPTYAEAGIPNFQSGTWVGFFVPAKTPDAVVRKLNQTLNESMELPAIRERLASLGLVPMTRSQADTEAYFKNELGNWSKMVRAVGLAGSN